MQRSAFSDAGRGACACFDVLHPVVSLVYWLVLLLVGMLSFQPVVTALFFAISLAQGALIRGGREVARSLAWQLPLVAVIAVVNPLFSASGSTELFRIGFRAVYAESLLYGACMGFALVGMLITFANAARVLSADKVMQLFGGVAPVVGLMLSMTMKLVPQLVRQGRVIDSAQRACTSARPHRTLGRRERMRDAFRLSSVLLGWSMEDSLTTADAMKARGWGAAKRRTAYVRERFRTADALVLVALLIVAAAAALMCWQVCRAFSFYPVVSGIEPVWYCVPFALYGALPFLWVAGVKTKEHAL
ncbi:energy-coupling factor transporter transmembrane component T family protein [Adlercreutzia sp. ZJ141]|uniref:energy-coupling factor transporter transmembrane component T family protein n=1 Tax=Adlercreutzia sp. ZJ141 TaxID=2709406 RepID=UPI0013ECC3CE|nr:energy-coupling factor transporter transmembrane component T [Adlercreutzia sp. ZJ141]